MDADNSLGTGAPPRHRSLPQARVGSTSRSGRPVPSVRPDSSTRIRVTNGPSSSARISNLAASFPLFFFGAGCIAVAFFIVLEGSHAAIGRIPLWVPFVALGIIALAGGSLSVFAEPDEPYQEETPEETTRSPRLPPPSSIAYDRVPRIRRPTHVASSRPPPRASDAATAKLASDEAPPKSSPSPVPPPRPAPVAVTPPSAVPFDDTASLLQEIDLIDAALHAPHLTAGRAPAPSTTSPRVSTASPAAKSVAPPATKVATVSPRSKPSPRMESEVPRQVAHCVGCGSVILHSGSPSKCRVCGETLCTECRDRSIAEGKPNLCPLCGLLDSVHSKGPSPPSPPRSRT